MLSFLKHSGGLWTQHSIILIYWNAAPALILKIFIANTFHYFNMDIVQPFSSGIPEKLQIKKIRKKEVLVWYFKNKSWNS